MGCPEGYDINYEYIGEKAVTQDKSITQLEFNELTNIFVACRFHYANVKKNEQVSGIEDQH